MAVKFEYDLNRDFVEVKDVLIEETLSAEDIEDGLEPEELVLKVALTKHSNDRMNDSEGRDCEWSLVQNLLWDKSDILFKVKNGEEFVMVNDKHTLALVCKMHQQNGVAVLILITVIRKVYMDNNYQEHEKRVYIDRKSNKVY
ncbi:hypothetical protein CVD28_01065 [Bacillus sp. M6-12]|uniref:hypothetical protein n=1 Tax=Bacillus sp. M6-12 TaxID=2054166 RepID=UPI000C769807|nr:hypothetical protein [Bacillus sp. M6-12]PLS19024.1 hypothetical protein CVD28_01065 [Bacillus sp. M6-12]